MDEKIILLIVASGKSSRFGGFPKAFCDIGNKMNVQNTIEMANDLYDSVYLAVNKETYPLYKDKVSSCTMFDIVTGQGDAHSLLKCLKYIQKKEINVRRITVCWGDAIFVSALPFAEIKEAMTQMETNIPGIVACAMDKYPYAWFETDKSNIKKSHFAQYESNVDTGLHDQSLFAFNIEVIIEYLEEYKQFLKIEDVTRTEGYAEQAEMKLLYSFDYFYGQGLIPMRYTMITSKQVFSFNTKEELKVIKERLKGNS